MNKLLLTAAAGAFAMSLGAQGAFAQDAAGMTLAGAQALITEVPGAGSCVEPAMISVPNGSTASEDQLRDAMGGFATYQEDVASYQGCLDNAATNMGEGLSEQHNMAVTILYDAAASKVEATGAEVNAAIRAFNEANPD
jgi:hypothetical protein